jgi:serine/threonine protein kinase
MVIAGKFTLLRLIAEGGAGAVFEAEDILIGRRVALKLMHPRLAHDPEIVRRFRREAQATAAVQHPNVVTVFEMGQRRDGSFFIAQEFLHGRDLRAHLVEHKRLGIQDAAAILAPIMRALGAAHQAGIVHRDVKPENIVLTRAISGETVPKLIDFGVAKMHSTGHARHLTQVGLLLGTASYMSPEQARGTHAVDARTDVWAVGAILFELLSGCCPYQAASDTLILVKIVSEPPPRIESFIPDIPAALASIVHEALEPDATKRFPSIHAFLDRLLAFVDACAISPKPVSTALAAALPVPRPMLFSIPEPREPEPLALPAKEAELDPEELIPVQSRPSARLAPTEPARAMSQAVARSHHGLEWTHDRPSVATHDMDDNAYAAEEALRVNALRDAIAFAESALQAEHAGDDVHGRMRLVQAIAHRWLGEYHGAERCAREAAQKLPHGSTGWYAAVGHVVIAEGYRGKSTSFVRILQDLAALKASGASSEAHVVTLCRLVVFLLRAGSPESARRTLQNARQMADVLGATEPIVRAWLDVAASEITSHEGDAGAYLQHVQSAAENFTSAGDIRNACLQHANVGNAYMQLGAYGRAVAVLLEALTLAEPMQLDFVATLKVNLGFAHAHLGQLDQALAMESTALEQAIQQGNRRVEGYSRIYLAVILSLQNDLEGAASAAQEAITTAEGLPGLHACALATLASILLMQNLPHPALSHARQAMSLLEKLEGVEEGQALIRATYALALRGTGSEPEGRECILDARSWLLDHARRISDPRWRQSFLENVPDNARVLHLADQWLEDHSRGLVAEK